MTNPLQIEAVNLEERLVILTNGDVLPITNFFAEDDELEDHVGAVSFVCGRGNVWFSALVEDFELQTQQ
jgi:hypothetical protein